MVPKRLRDCELVVLHEFGAPGHYVGAIAAASAQGIDRIDYVEFSIFKKLIGAILNRDLRRIRKALRDIVWLLLCFIWPQILRNKKVIIGIAPLDWRIIFVIRIVGKAKIIYHSSWTSWDGSKYAKESFLFKNIIFKIWQIFIKNKVSHFALVTELVGSELTKNFSVSMRMQSIVYHSYDQNLFFHDTENKGKSLKLLFIGRLVFSKGVYELLELAKNFPHCSFCVLGDGPLQSVIQKSGLANIHYHGFVKEKREIARICKEQDIILVPSRRTSSWEELFGMALVEAMACGCVPITTDHPGPLTIIKDDELRDLIYSELEFVHKSKEAIDLFCRDNSLLRRLQSKSASDASRYSLKNIEKIWNNILDNV